MKNDIEFRKGFNPKYKLWSLFVVFLLGFNFAFGQAKPDKTALEIKKLETQLKTAKTNFAKTEKQVAIADSLIETGTKMTEESETEFEQLEADLKKLDKDYATQSKALFKKINGKDKDAAAEAKIEFKEVDTKYKADVKEQSAKKKLIEKKSITGTANLDKGKASKKMAVAPYEKAKESVEAIEAKIEALKSGGDETETKGKKRKK